MANNLKEQAIQTFCIVPEVYQQAFQEKGAEFPDELVAQIKENPKNAINLLSQDPQLTDAIVKIFNEKQDTIMQAAQQASGIFKEGGKLKQGLERLQKGGTINSSFTRVVKAPGDTLDTKRYLYSTQTRQTKPDGSVVYSVDTKGYSDKYYDPRKTIPNWFRRIVNGGMRPVPADIKQNWDEILKNHTGEVTIDKTKLQDGGSFVDKERINNKYFNLLEKAGRKSSKEMEDLTSERKAELKKVK